MKSLVRRFTTAAVAVTVLWIAPSLPAQQSEEPNPALVGFEDHRPALDDPVRLRETLEQVRRQASEIDEAVEAHAAARRRALSDAAGTTVEGVAIYEDLMRFPEANRGKAIVVRGELKEAKPITLDGHDATLLHVTPVGAAQGTVAVVTDADATALAEQGNVQAVGVFLKLAELSAAGGASRVAPLVVAATVEALQAGDGLLPDRSLWSVVQHRSLGVRDAESGLYFRLLEKARGADPAELRRVAADHVDARRKARPQLRDESAFPVFVDMFQNPKDYEGQAVALEGYAREVRKYPAGANSAGLETLYEVWIFTDDSQSNPAVVVASEAPPDLPVGTDLQVPVRVVGYFFKAYAYKAQDTPRVAPMILAGRIDVLPEPVIDGPPWWLLGLLATGFLALIGWLVRSYMGERRRRVKPVEETPDFAEIE